MRGADHRGGARVARRGGMIWKTRVQGGGGAARGKDRGEQRSRAARGDITVPCPPNTQGGVAVHT